MQQLCNNHEGYNVILFVIILDAVVGGAVDLKLQDSITLTDINVVDTLLEIPLQYEQLHKLQPPTST